MNGTGDSLDQERTPEDRQKHQSLIEELVSWLEEQGYRIDGAEGMEGYAAPLELSNDGYGDQEDKAPDISAFDVAQQQMIIGEAKTGAEDFESDHALTQYNVFLDQVHRLSLRRAMLFVIVPSGKVAEFNTLITHYLHPDLWGNIVVVQSRRWES